jgi:hypothetical protein
MQIRRRGTDLTSWNRGVERRRGAKAREAVMSTSDSEPLQCDQLSALLSQFIDDELPPEKCRLIRAHLGECASCRDLMSTLRLSIQAARDWLPCETPRPLTEETRRRLHTALCDALSRRRVT